MRCCALPCCVLCCTFANSCMPVTYEVSYHVPVLLISHQVCAFYVVGSQTMHPQLTSARLYKLSSAAQCGAVPCPSFCGAVSCGAVRSFELLPGTIMYVLCTRLFAFFSCDCPLSVPMFPHPCKYHTYCRSERDINTAQRRAISSAQAPQLSIRTNNHGPLLPAPLLRVSVAFFLARP